MAGEVIVVTGGFGVLAAAVAAEATARGARVALVDRAPDPGGPGGDLRLGGVDLTSPDAAEAALAAVARRFGRVDGLVNAAGAFRWQTLEDGAPAAWAELYAANVLTAANTARAALPHLLAAPAGRIVNVGANAALKAGAGMGAYAAAKSGLHRLTESLAEELKGRGVTVSAVLPSIIDTPANRAEMPDADHGAWVSPASLAHVILFLLSDAARDVTGALIPVVGRVV